MQDLKNEEEVVHLSSSFNEGRPSYKLYGSWCLEADTENLTDPSTVVSLLEQINQIPTVSY